MVLFADVWHRRMLACRKTSSTPEAVEAAGDTEQAAAARA
jgi:hypothetical protein